MFNPYADEDKDILELILEDIENRYVGKRVVTTANNANGHIIHDKCVRVEFDLDQILLVLESGDVVFYSKKAEENGSLRTI